MHHQSQHSCLKYQTLSSKSESLWRIHMLACILHWMVHIRHIILVVEVYIIFMSRLVDSRDIAELQVKQLDCEILIRKKGALPPAAPVASMPPPLTHVMLPSPPPPAATASASPPPSAPVSTSPAPAKASTSSHPPLKCPMAGTFYRCPGPGEPPFVKVSFHFGEPTPWGLVPQKTWPIRNHVFNKLLVLVACACACVFIYTPLFTKRKKQYPTLIKILSFSR